MRLRGRHLRLACCAAMLCSLLSRTSGLAVWLRRPASVAQTCILPTMRSTRMRGLQAAAVCVGTGVSLAAGAAAFGAAWWLLRTRRRYPVRGKVVLVTGSSRGLGLAMAQRFGERGARVVLTARSVTELDAARTLLLQRRAVSPDDVLTIPCDVRDNGQVKAMFREVAETWSPVEVLVNNAGIITVGPMETLALSAYQDAMQTNFFGTVHCTLAALPYMLARGDGAIANIASIGGNVAVPHLLPYSASKFATVGFSQGLTAEVLHKGVRVTTVSPGLLRTGSPLHAIFSGRSAEEYRWFNLSASLPGISRNAYAAAGRVVKAVERGELSFSITPQAAIAARLAQVWPALTMHTLALVNRLLPTPAHRGEQYAPGKRVQGRDLKPLTAAGDAAQVLWNERGMSTDL